MFEWTHTVTTSATPEQVWPLYAEVGRWLEWDSGLQGVTLEGPFAVGSRGTLQVEGQPPLAWELIEVTDNASFTDVTEIPGVATLTFVHRIEARAEGSAIVHEVRIEGPAAAQLGPMVTSDTPEAMEALARLASGA
ncbi:MAG TPA: SRPBCC family protein [Candidatus Nanopelagicales bacterium]|nr:SRPBCC family protein [Candidatus Nanopelagicales bacterium]